jgi:RimJ/RimL family protein N-acetyltransferase
VFPTVVETERLRLRRATRELLEPVDAYRYFSTTHSDTVAEETRYVRWSPHETPGETAEFLSEVETQWDDGESAVYAIYPRADEDGAGEFAGTAGLGFEWEKRAAELGIWLRKPFWGRGYSGERAAALFDLAFDRLDLAVVAVAHVPDNDQSERAIRKYVDRFGGRREGLLRNEIVDSDGAVHDARRYSVSQAEWREAVADDRPAVRYP